MSNPTGQTGVDAEQLTHDIYEAMQLPHLSERHDAIKRLMEAHTSAVLDRVEKGMPEVIGPNIPNIKGAVMYTYVNNILAEQRTKFTDLMKKVREEL